MRNYFTFDGVDSRSFGVYISGQGTFKAPARSYDALEIPGRNGALLGIDSRLGNVELTYPAFIYSNFAENIAAFRAFLLSHKGYFKLKDSYHPDEFRLAYYPGPFEPDVTSANNAGSFDITFICKPQRYLESGEEVIELIPGQSETHTYTGNPASFVALGGEQITSLQIPLRFYQDLHGYDHPWPGGGGVNKLPNLRRVATTRIVIGQEEAYTDLMIPLTAGTYTLAITHTVSNNYQVYARHGSTNTQIGTLTVDGGTQSFTFTVDSAANYSFSVYRSGGVDSDAITQFWLVSGSDAGTYTPYENICPISGLTGLSVYVSPTQDPDNATVYNVDWSTQAGTVYHGTIDPVAGQLTVDKASVDLGSINWTYGSGYTYPYFIGTMPNDCVAGTTVPGQISVICSIYDSIQNIGASDFRTQDHSFQCCLNSNVATKRLLVQNSAYTDASTFKTAMEGVQLVYDLETPVTYQLTPTQIAALLAGETFVWSSNNEGVTVEVTSIIPTIIENPTLFDALPFLRVYGTGILGIGSHTITITAADVYTDIDCEMMDCFKGSANKNQYVQFSGNDFPTLEPGVNGFSFSGITKVEVKPRWWSV